MVSYGATLGLRRRPPFLTVRWLLAHFAEDIDLARIRFREWVEDGLAEAAAEPPSNLGSIFKISRRPPQDAVRRARAGGFSVADIARHLGVSVRTVQRWLATEP
jgi:DNA invertase Pin-like site-specific DNA recombinase